MFHEDRLSSKERGGQGRLLSQCDGGSQRETSIFCGDIPVFKTGTGEDLAGQKISWPEDAQKGENSTGALDFLQGQRIPQAESKLQKISISTTVVRKSRSRYASKAVLCRGLRCTFILTFDAKVCNSSAILEISGRVNFFVYLNRSH